MGLLQDLFDKSGKEIEKIEDDLMYRPPEGGIDPDTLHKTLPYKPEEMSEEDRKIMERVLKFRKQEGRKADGSKADLSFDDDMEFDTLMAEDPAFAPLGEKESANPVEESQLKGVIARTSELVHGEAMPKFINKLKSGEAFEVVGETVFELLKKEANELGMDAQGVEPAVFISPSGAVPIVTNMVWKLGQAAGIEGMNDRNQYAAAVINVYRKMGEHIIEQGDDASIGEAEELATSIALAEGGGITPSREEEGMLANQAEQKPLAAGISNALLGGQV